MHRDLKPENILIQLIDNQFVVKLIDFGLSKLNKYAQTVVGTTGYMAPEIQMSKNDVIYDERVDMWSAGAVLYFLLHGYSPFIVKGSLRFTYYQAENDMLLPYNYSAGNELIEILDKQLQHNIKQRAYANDILEQLQKHNKNNVNLIKNNIIINEIKITFIGDFGVGKTSLIKRFAKTSMQISISSISKLINGNPVNIIFHDTQGTEQMTQSLVPQIFRGSDIVILVYKDMDSYDSLEKWKSTVSQWCSPMYFIISSSFNGYLKNSSDIQLNSRDIESKFDKVLTNILNQYLEKYNPNQQINKVQAKLVVNDSVKKTGKCC
ncbi:Kinase [Hexamita inflata]|uniref:Kinase n=1 Tax=Hexamita inflata TaxID=28002 RepID=A0ABP1I723_9EUKA